MPSSWRSRRWWCGSSLGSWAVDRGHYKRCPAQRSPGAALGELANDQRRNYDFETADETLVQGWKLLEEHGSGEPLCPPACSTSAPRQIAKWRVFEVYFRSPRL